MEISGTVFIVAALVVLCASSASLLIMDDIY